MEAGTSFFSNASCGSRTGPTGEDEDDEEDDEAAAPTSIAVECGKRREDSLVICATKQNPKKRSGRPPQNRPVEGAFFFKTNSITNQDLGAGSSNTGVGLLIFDCLRCLHFTPCGYSCRGQGWRMAHTRAGRVPRLPSMRGRHTFSHSSGLSEIQCGKRATPRVTSHSLGIRAFPLL